MNTETKHVNRGKGLLNIIETVEGFNKTTNILTATIIYQPYAKKITAREDGNGIITHWNNSNVQIVNNITD